VKRFLIAGLFGLVCLSAAASDNPLIGPQIKMKIGRTSSWRELLPYRIEEFGHRNWIVIADSAYPAQTRAGIETVLTGANQLKVVEAVLDQLALTKHIRPVVYLDAELPHVSDKDAPGINAYRRDLKALLGDREPHYLPHEQIIDRLDKTAEKFKVLLLKTNLKLPYTSVFLELDCGYWSPEAEQRLRKTLATEKK
jgi:L-fucose mutarotase/ribose pyranase (RbsD/FucU family)